MTTVYVINFKDEIQWMALQGQVQAVLHKGAKLVLKHKLELTLLLI